MWGIATIPPWSRLEPGQPERSQVEAGRLLLRQVRKGLADRRRKFESVARTGAREQHPRFLGGAAQDEVAVRRVGVEAHRALSQRLGQAGKARRPAPPQ